jgi:hypothetical protein
VKFNKGDILVPRGKQYPEGALVADGYDDAGRLMAHPVGGGLQHHIPRESATKLRVADEAERAGALFHSGRFVLADSEEVFAGWSNGRLWNGWEMPRFEGAEAQRLLAWLGDRRARFDAGRDAYVTISQEGEEEAWIAGLIAITDGSRIKAYPVGAGAWTWEEA